MVQQYTRSSVFEDQHEGTYNRNYDYEVDNNEETKSTIRVSANSQVRKVAGAIAGILRENERGKLKIRAIGAGAVNQATKGIILAIQYLSEENIHILSSLTFTTTYLDGKERTAIVFEVERSPIIIYPSA